MNFQEEFNKLDLPKSLAIGIGLAFAYWFLLFNDGSALDAEILQLEQKINQERQAKARVEKAKADKVKFDAEIKNIYRNMKDFQRFFTPDMDTPKLQEVVSNLSEKHSLSVNSLKPLTRSPEFNGYIEVAVEFEVEGSFHNVMEFISSLTAMGKAIDFNTMEFSTQGMSDFPSVKFKSTLVVYGSSELTEDPGGKNG